MRRYYLIILVLLLSDKMASAQDPDQQVKFETRTISIRKIIGIVEEQATFRFSFGNTAALERKITLPAGQLSISQLLAYIKNATGISFEIKGPKILVIPPATKHTIQGYIRDNLNKESLMGANVYEQHGTAGTSTNEYGFYSLTLPDDSVRLVVSYIGYQPFVYSLKLQCDTIINVDLAPTVLSEVTISAEQNIHEITQMSSFNLSMSQMKRVPTIGGEVDIMKSLQLLPGVQSGNEGTSGLYVRGGGPDQNLILLDGVPVYNASHLFGFFSIFNPDAIHHVELIKGGFPARFGGRLSSVIDIRLKEGNLQALHGEGSLGLISSKFTLEGPIKKERSSFILSGRRTYIDLLARPFLRARSSENNFGYYFYDLSAKLNQILNTNNRVYFSVYTGTDKGYSETESTYRSDISGATGSSRGTSDLNWGNLISAVRWNHVMSTKVFSNLTMTYSHYRFKVDAFNEARHQYPGKPDFTQVMTRLYQSGIQDYSLRYDVDYDPSPAHSLRLGGYGIRHYFKPGATNIQSNATQVNHNADAKISLELGGYIEDDIAVATKLKANVGAHYSGLHVDGKFFTSLQPRVSVSYLVRNDLSAKVSFATMTQYIHLLANGGIGLPTDLWVPATSRVKPEQSVQFAAGLAYGPVSSVEITLESYYKSMENVIEYKDGASYVDTENDWENKVEIGNGESYGLELFVHKKTGKYTGWFGYTLSKTTRSFNKLNFGETFPFRYDRRHDIEININRELKKNVGLSATWVFASGNPMTVPVAEYSSIPDIEQFPPSHFETATYFGKRNSYRMRPTHRLDLSVSFRKEKKWGERSWVVGVYNAYSRQNPFYLQIERDSQGYKKLYEYGLFPIIPSVSYNIKF